MKGRTFEAGHTTAPDHMPDRAKIPLASKGASTHVRRASSGVRLPSEECGLTALSS